jgi:starch synthase (maltosyl-transferring)
VAVNLNPYYKHAGFIEVPLSDFGIDPERPYVVEDLISGAAYTWQGARNYVELDPTVCPAHVFRLKKRVRSEKDFENFA